jgi:hypothetical protein
MMAEWGSQEEASTHMGVCIARAGLFAAIVFVLGPNLPVLGGDASSPPPVALRAGWVGPPVMGSSDKRLGGEWFSQGTPILAVAISPDSRTVALTAENGDVCLRDVGTGAFLRRLDTTGRLCLALAFSPDGEKLALGFQEARVGVWDVATGKARWQTRTRDAFGPMALAFSADGKLLAGGTVTGNVRIWDEAGEQKHVCEYGGSLRFLSFSNDGRNVAGGGDSGLKQWDAVTGQELGMGFPRGGMGGFGRGRSTYAVAYTPDGQFLAAGGDRGTIMIWDLAVPRQGMRLGDNWQGGEVDWLAFLPGSRILVSTSTPDDHVRLWDVDRGAADGDFALVEHSDRDRMRPIAVSREGWLITASGPEGSVRVYDLAAGAPGPEDAKIETLWSSLADRDSLRALRAVGTLASKPGEAIALLRRHLRPAASTDTRDVRALLASLDDDRFAERERAESSLKRLGPSAEPAIAKLLAGAPSAEARERALRVLESFRSKTAPPMHAENRRSERALLVLARIATPEARELLDELSEGAPDSPQTKSAKAILEHLESSK